LREAASRPLRGSPVGGTHRPRRMSRTLREPFLIPADLTDSISARARRTWSKTALPLRQPSARALSFEYRETELVLKAGNPFRASQRERLAYRSASSRRQRPGLIPTNWRKVRLNDT
jgi:hypothetical protein